MQVNCWQDYSYSAPSADVGFLSARAGLPNWIERALTTRVGANFQTTSLALQYRWFDATPGR